MFVGIIGNSHHATADGPSGNLEGHIEVEKRRMERVVGYLDSVVPVEQRREGDIGFQPCERRTESVMDTASEHNVTAL
jgi:hypothetical protein